MKVLLFVLINTLLFSCAANHSRPSNGAKQAEAKTATRLIVLGEVLDSMNTSKVLYQVLEKKGAFTDMAMFDAKANKADPQWYIDQDKDGNTMLLAYKNNECASKLEKDAFEFMDAKDFSNALIKYKEAYGCDPENKKLLTYVGNMFFNLKQLDSAKAYFQQALKLNPFDYQAHFFLSDTYYRLGVLDSAKVYLIKAMALNGRNVNLLTYGEHLLKERNEKIDYSRLKFDYEIIKTDTSVIIYDGSQKHMIMGMVDAGLNYDPAFKGYLDSLDELKLPLYKSVFLSQIIIAQEQLQKNENPDEMSKKLIDIFEGDLLEPMILWEISAYKFPAIMYLMPSEVLEKVENYIAKYVIVPLEAL